MSTTFSWTTYDDDMPFETTHKHLKICCSVVMVLLMFCGAFFSHSSDDVIGFQLIVVANSAPFWVLLYFFSVVPELKNKRNILPRSNREYNNINYLKNFFKWKTEILSHIARRYSTKASKSVARWFTLRVPRPLRSYPRIHISISSISDHMLFRFQSNITDAHFFRNRIWMKGVGSIIWNPREYGILLFLFFNDPHSFQVKHVTQTIIRKWVIACR